MPGRWKTVLFLLLFIILSTLVWAETEKTFFISAAGEMWTTPEFGGQGIGIFGLELKSLPRNASFQLLLNTETLQIDYGNIRFGMFELGFRVKGELFFAGLLPNYFLEGKKVPEYGFNASYLEGESRFIFRFSDSANLALSLRGKQWFFGRNDASGESFVLPENRFVFTPQLNFTYWAFTGDPSILQPHYYFYRIKGFGFSLYGGTHISSNTAQWGAADASGNFLNERNSPERASLFIRQWFRWGGEAGGIFRFQIAQRAGFGYGEDDLTRDRIGGMNPYVVPVHGLPWGSILSETYAAGELSMHINMFGDSEIILIVDAAGIKDLERISAERWGFVLGSALALDFRFGDWFLNWRFGYSFVPALWENKHYTGVFLGFGTTF